MKVNNKRLQKLILDSQKSIGQLSKLAYETGVQDGLIKANAFNALKPLDNTKMRWTPCSERGMNIDETIKTYEELSKTASGIDHYQHYAVEYKQVADWLKELKKFRELFDSVEEAEQLLEEHMV